jgi:hypothetical protein
MAAVGFNTKLSEIGARGDRIEWRSSGSCLTVVIGMPRRQAKESTDISVI